MTCAVHSHDCRPLVYLHAPLEDAQRATSREGLLRVLQPQHTLAAVQALVNVGVRLHLEAAVLPSTDVHLQSRVFLIQHLERIE